MYIAEEIPEFAVLSVLLFDVMSCVTKRADNLSVISIPTFALKLYLSNCPFMVDSWDNLER